MRRAPFVLLLLAACPESDDDDNATGSDTETSSSGSTGAPCSTCGGDESCHSTVGDSGHCVCEAGHQWAEPENDDDFTCVPIPPRPGDECLPENHAMMVNGECSCVPGYNWCSDEPDDLTCCEDASQDGGSDSSGG